MCKTHVKIITRRRHCDDMVTIIYALVGNNTTKEIVSKCSQHNQQHTFPV